MTRARQTIDCRVVGPGSQVFGTNARDGQIEAISSARRSHDSIAPRVMPVDRAPSSASALGKRELLRSLVPPSPEPETLSAPLI